MLQLNDTICAPATLPGTGAISIIRISGPDTFRIIDSQISFIHGCASQAKGYTIKRGRFGELDDILVAFFRSPASYTGEDCAELYCHASAYIVQQALDRLCKAGCRLAEAGEFTRRAFLAGKLDLAQAEAVADVIASQTEAQHKIAMNQLKGGYSSELAAIRKQMVELAGLVELELDFSEEDVEFADRSRLRSLLGNAEEKCEKLAESFRIGNAIRRGIPIAIVGEPNSGKSTLLNALLGDERAIVSEFAGTTRDTVEECAVIGGMLFRFIDTAGIRDSEDPVERMGIGRSIEKLKSAEIVLIVSDCTEDGLSEQEKHLIGLTDCQVQKVILLRNKCDLLNSEKRNNVGFVGDNINVTDDNKVVLLIGNKEYALNTLNISAKQGYGLEELRQMLSGWAGQDRTSETTVTNARHAEALRRSAEALRRSISALDNNLSAELLAEDLRAAISHISEITGEITTDEILGEIFGRFCIGK